MGIEPTSEAWEVLNISIPFTASISISARLISLIEAHC
jgi:hypothetical protein